MGRRVVLLAVLALPLVACGDDDGDAVTGTSATTESSAGTDTTRSSPSSTPPLSSSGSEADQSAAEAALLVLTDFPTGWREVPESGAEEDQEVQTQVGECAGADGTAAVDFGGAAAETGDFASPSAETVQHRVGVAGSVSAAEERIAGLAAPEFGPCVQAVYQEFFEDYVEDEPLPEDATLGEVSIARLDVSPVGDEVVAYRLTVPIDLGGSTIETYADLVAVRSGRAVAGLTFASESVPFSTEDIGRYVALAAERLGEAF